MAPSSYIDVPEYLWYGEDLVKLDEKLQEVIKKSKYQFKMYWLFFHKLFEHL